MNFHIGGLDVPEQDELVRDVQRALRGSSQSVAEAVVLASEPLWDALAGLGFVDSWGASEYRSLFPDMLTMVQGMANQHCWCQGKQRDDCPDLRHQAQKALDMYRVFIRALAQRSPALALLDEKQALGLLPDEQFHQQECELLRFYVRLEARQVSPPT